MALEIADRIMIDFAIKRFYENNKKNQIQDQNTAHI